jgi:cation-transporting ATPase I
MISDVLPALAIGLQRPEQRNLASLAREGAGSLEEPLHRDILRRGFCTAAPAIVAYLAMRGAGVPVARTVGFASIVATQLAQTLDMGIPNRSTVGALLASAGLLVAALTFAPLRNLLTLAPLPPLGWALVAGASLAAVLLSRMLSSLPNGKRRWFFSRPALS